MSITDLMIIYLACGSPFGVYYFTSLRDDPSPSSILIVLFRFLVWPVSMIALLRMSLFSATESVEAILDKKISNIRTELEDIAFSGAAASSIFDLREIFSRYTGLTRELKVNGSMKPMNEILVISGHENQALAAACLNRRNRERLMFHQTQARNDFVDLVSNLANGSPKGDRIAGLAMALAELLNDPKSAEDLSVLLSSSGQELKGTDFSDLQKDVWKPRTRAARAVN